MHTIIHTNVIHVYTYNDMSQFESIKNQFSLNQKISSFGIVSPLFVSPSNKKILLNRILTSFVLTKFIQIMYRLYSHVLSGADLGFSRGGRFSKKFGFLGPPFSKTLKKQAKKVFLAPF